MVSSQQPLSQCQQDEEAGYSLQETRWCTRPSSFNGAKVDVDESFKQPVIPYSSLAHLAKIGGGPASFREVWKRKMGNAVIFSQ